MTIAQCIREARKAKGLTQKELAKAAGIAEITIRKYENNERQPKVEQIEKIAQALGLTAFELTGWDYFDQKINTLKLAKEVSDMEVFEKYLMSLGYNIEANAESITIRKDKMTAVYSHDEFDELQAKFFELQANNQDIIENRIRKKAESKPSKK